MEPKIRQLLGITGKAGELYPLLPPILFPGNIINRSRKTLFGNWQPIAKVHAIQFIQFLCLIYTNK